MHDAFTLVSRWRIAAPLDVVWAQLRATRDWPKWWSYVREVVELCPGDAAGVGAVQRFTWHTRLPYRIRLVMRVTRLEPLRLIEAEADGDLSGHGCWLLRPVPGATRVFYEWRVHARKPWMRWLARGLRPVYVWNHAAVMRAGEAGLAAYLAPRTPVTGVRT
jgi:hypothetical protein